MREERGIILRMLQEGKISVEDANALLEALQEPKAKQEPKAQVKEEDGEEFWEKIERFGEEFAEKVEVSAEKFARTLEQKIDGGLADKLSKLPKFLAGLQWGGSGETYEFKSEYTGTWDPLAKEYPVTLSTSNGKIRVEGWDEEYYKLEVVQKVRAESESEAEAKLLSVPLQGLVDHAKELVVIPQPNNRVSLSYYVYLPRKRPYVIALQSQNGSLSVDNLVAKDISSETSNGSLSLRQVRCDKVHARSANGSVKFDFVQAKEIIQETTNGSIVSTCITEDLQCATTNGSVKVQLMSFLGENNKLNLKTTNGSVKCRLPHSEDCGYAVDAQTSVGKAKVELDRFKVDSHSTGPSHYVRGKTEGFEEQPKKAELMIRTKSGSVVVNHKDND